MSVKTHQTVLLLKQFIPQQPNERRLRSAAWNYSLGSFDVDAGSVFSFISTMRRSVKKKEKSEESTLENVNADWHFQNAFWRKLNFSDKYEDASPIMTVQL